MPGENVVTTVGERTLALSNLDKVLFPEAHYTKAEVISYYLGIADTMLPHLAGRCLTRVRFPNGVDAPAFYEKNLPAGAPDWLSVQPVLGTEGRIDYLVVTEPATLVYLANLAALELHAPQWTVAHTTMRDGAVLLGAEHEPRATMCVVDLDPGPGMTMLDVCKGALLLGARLAADGLIASVKTTGSKGLQLSAPIAPTPSEEVVRYVARLAAEMSRTHPDLFVATMAKSARTERIYIDYLQNKAARNTVCAYSLRGKEQPWVATPLTWDEVAAADRPDALRFRPEEVLARVAEKGDLFADVLADDGPPVPLTDSEG
ncbi:MAG TPA: non-homologous end-joining DNA ligase [Propionibacteriaceae bacterium]|nr:non-homologous end-joining DNA ligase [Propionibacteriaceae bacterium]